MDNEIVIVPNWVWVWWDKKNDNVSIYAPTGTSLEFMERRYIQTRGREIHALDGGDVVTKWSTRWEDSKSFTTYWQECVLCGKQMNFGEY